MDPISHGIIGIAVSSFSQDSVSIHSAVTIGSMLGAMSPDLDFVIRIFKDDVKYLEEHRGFSHSVPMLMAFSVGITVLLSTVGFADFSFFQTLLWTFLGAVSHTAFDILNSYGAQFFHRKRKGNLLTLYDPVLTVVCMTLILRRQNGVGAFMVSLAVSGLYLWLRFYLRKRASNRLSHYFAKTDVLNSVIVMPSLKSFYKWDFVVEAEMNNYIGQYNPFLKQPIRIIKVLDNKDMDLMTLVLKTPIGQKFSKFSPSLHIEVIEKKQTSLKLRIVDQRYFFRNTFLHQATLVLDRKYHPVESVFHPYKLSKEILVAV